MSWAGLRGAVGIALALSLQSEVWQVTADEQDEELKHASREDAVSGSIAYRFYVSLLLKRCLLI